MASDLMNQERTRRGLLAAAVAASVAAVAASVARINPVRAADGDAVTVGSENVGDNVTSFETTDTYALAGTLGPKPLNLWRKLQIRQRMGYWRI